MKKNPKSLYFFQKTCIAITFIMLTTSFAIQATAANSGSSIFNPNEIMQEKRITGIVKDQLGDPMPGVSIVIKGTTQGTTTNMDGDYDISNVPNNAILIFSFIGMETQEVSVSGKTQINVILAEDAIGLEEVVAIGYGVARKSDVTGAVSTVKADEFVKRPVTRFEQALQGTTPGVAVISGSGNPGKGLSVKIRGANSITGGTEPLYVIDGNIGGDINSLNPNDIASVEILKDASSTAIYGSRGTNGVVLITTKSGETGDTRVNLSTWFSHASIPKQLDLMNGAEFARSINQYYRPDAFSNEQIAELERTGGTNWMDELTQNAWTQNYDLNVSGGTAAVKYRVSFNHLKQDGMIINSWHKKSNLRANLDIRVNSRMDVKLNVSYLEPSSRNNNYEGDIYDPFSAVNIFDPTFPVYDSNGDYTISSAWASNGHNPVGNVMDRANDNTEKHTVGTGVLTYKIIDGLTFTTNNTYSSSSSFNKEWRGPNTGDALGGGGITQAVMESRSWYSFQNSNFLTYDKDFGDHRVTATLLYEQSKYENISHRGQARGLSTPALTYYNLGLGSAQQTSSKYDGDAMQSYMLRVNYGYKNRYLVTASIRRDGSSKLTEKYDNFPSMALAWNITQEDFLRDHSVISGLKLRASYGETGNQAVGAYSTLAQIDIPTERYYFDGTTSTQLTQLGTVVSKQLVWEHAKQTDIGLDLILFNGKFTFTADVYNKDIVDLLYDYNAPNYMGGGSYKRNMGKLNNKGLEMAFGGMPVSNRDFSWNTSLTVSFNKNKVVDLMGEDDLPVSGIGTFGAQISRMVVGNPLGDFFGYNFLGTWKTNEADEAAKFGLKPGDAKYEDLNGDYVINTDDRMIIGNGTPDVSFGFINDFKYKNFTASIMFQGMAGNDVFSQTMGSVWGGHGMARNATIREVKNIWTPENETDVPVLAGTTQSHFNSSRFVYNGSFIKLKNLYIGYNIPRSVLSKLFVHSLEVYASGQNLLTFTKFPGYDPEVNSSNKAQNPGVEMGAIPNPRTYTFGLRLGF